MAGPKFPPFLNLPSSDKLEKLLSCTGKAGHTKERNQDKHKYFLSLCRYSCTLPPWDQDDKQFSEHYNQSLLDMALMKASERGEFLKWSRLTTPVYAVAVPDDGQSLFHAVSMAMWGLQDKHSTLKLLMENAAPDMADSLKTRWQIHASDLKAKDRQLTWANIISRLMGVSSIFTTVRKDEEIDSLVIFILANVLHRPIIVIDFESYASSYATENITAEGIYLPLEKPALECSKSPIVLCYRHNRFCPLMFMSSVEREAVFPLHKGDLSLLPVRYGCDHRDAVTQIRQYLNVQEKDVVSNSGSTMTLLCSSVSIVPLPEHFNSVNVHLRKCQEIFQDFVASKQKNGSEKLKVYLPPVVQHFGSPFQHIDESNQTYVVPIKGSRKKEGSFPSPGQSFSSPPPLSLFNSATSLAHRGHEGLPTNSQMSMVPNNINEPQREREGIDERSNCLTPGCANERDPGTGELCYSCFTRSTVSESGLELMSLYEEGKRRYVLRQTCLPGADNDQRHLSTLHPRNEVPFLENASKASSEMSFLSAVNESCKGCSHFYCSQKTYPYCHECSKNASQDPRESYQNVTSGVAVKKQTFPDVFLPPMNLKNPPGSSFDQKQDNKRKQDEIEDSQIAQHFCQSEGCQNLRQENSKMCHQCSCLKKPFEDTSFVPQIAKPIEQVSSSGTWGSLEFAQAECLFHNSDEDVIEISEAPSLKNDVHKCASPVCEALIPSSQMLCDKCQTILISHSQLRPNRKEHPKAPRNDWENQQILSPYRASTFSGIIASPPSSSVREPKKSQSEKIKSAPDPNIAVRPKEKSSDKDKVKRMFDTVSHNSGSISVSPNQIMAHAFAHQDPQPSSSSRFVDNDFQKMYTQFTSERLKDISQCRSGLCQNFGNKQKHGYCNSCFALLSEREKHDAIFGRTEIDS